MLNDMNNGPEITVTGLCMEMIERMAKLDLCMYPPVEERGVGWRLIVPDLLDLGDLAAAALRDAEQRALAVAHERRHAAVDAEQGPVLHLGDEALGAQRARVVAKDDVGDAGGVVHELGELVEKTALGVRHHGSPHRPRPDRAAPLGGRQAKAASGGSTRTSTSGFMTRNVIRGSRRKCRLFAGIFCRRTCSPS